MVSFIFSFCYTCFPFVLKRDRILITLGSISMDGLNVNLVCGRLGNTLCVLLGVKCSHTGHPLPHRLTYFFYSGETGPSELYSILTILTRWKSFRIRTSFIKDLDPLERIGELWPLSGEDWLLLQLTRIGYNFLSSGDYDPPRGLGGGMAPSLERIDLSFSLGTLTWIGLVCRLDLCDYFFLEHFAPNPLSHKLVSV